jgi:Ca-activated chloride channel family protein
MVKPLQARAIRRVARGVNGWTAAIVPPLTGRRVRFTLTVTAALFTLFPYALAQAAGQFASGVSLVEVYATVTDAAGRPIEGLRADDFVVEEDGAPQKVETFAAGEFPLSVAVGIDRSFSMAPATLAAAVAGTRAFVNALRRADQVMLIAIGSETEVLSPLASDRTQALAALERIERWGTTPLFDAVLAAIAAVQPASGRRALVLLSDGVDRYSHATAAQVVTDARQHDVLVYPVTIGAVRPPVWAEVASVSGGRSFFARDPREIGPTLAAIGDELRHQYLLGYAPPPARGGDGRAQWRSIRVRVTRPQARVRARDGYFAP